MATDRPRIQAYLDPELYQRFAEWKLERGMAKDSEALNGLLAEYFGVSSSSASAPVPQLPTEAIEKTVRDEVNALFKNKMEEDADFWVNRLSERLTTVEKSLERFIGCSHQQIDELKSDLGERLATCEDSLEVLLSESATTASNSLDATRSPQEEELENFADIVEEEAELLEEQATGATYSEEVEYRELPGDSLSDLPKSVNGSELARRLGIAKSVISNRKARTDFEEWSKGKDPEAIAWRYDARSLQFFPVKEDRA